MATSINKYLFPKELLLKSDSLELFKLHLPNISSFIENIPDHFHLIYIQEELKNIFYSYNIGINYDKHKLEILLNKFPLTREMLIGYMRGYQGPMFNNIIPYTNSSQETKEFYKFYKATNDFYKVFDSTFGPPTGTLNEFETNYINNNKELIDFIKPRFDMRYKPITSILLSVNSIANEDNKIEYIKWLIELASTLQCPCNCITDKYYENYDSIFWHPHPKLKKINIDLYNLDIGLTKYNKKLYKNILPYIKSGVCFYIPICKSKYKCEFCPQSIPLDQ